MSEKKYKLAVQPNSLKLRSDVLFFGSKPLLINVNEQTGEVKFYLDPRDLEKIQKTPIQKLPD